jgi:RND family efflux transporter MFP subunit
MRPYFACIFLLAAFPAKAADYACLIEPRQTLKLSAAVVGVVRSISVDRGDQVKKGQLVAHLDSEVEEADVLIGQLRATNDADIAGAQAKLDLARQKLLRKTALQGNTYGSKAELEESQADVRVAEAQLRSAVFTRDQAILEAHRAEAQVHQRQVLSPVNGVVTHRDLGQGEYSNEQSSIVTIAEMDPLRVETYLPASLFGRVKVGDSAEVLPDPPVGGTYRGKVTVVDPVLDAASNTIGVRLELPNPDLTLPAGIHCMVRFGNAS